MDKLIVQVPNYQRNKNVGSANPRPLTDYRYMLTCSCIRYGPQLKMLKSTFDCNVYKGPVGSKIGNAFSFSGASRLRSATTNVSPTYYTRHSEYMKGRASTFPDGESVHFVDGVAYSNTPVTTATETCAKEVVYKRSNPTFGYQGAVDSSLRSAKLVYDTVRTNPYNPLKKTQPYSGCTTGCS